MGLKDPPKFDDMTNMVKFVEQVEEYIMLE
jgi:hypothetical protein